MNINLTIQKSKLVQLVNTGSYDIIPHSVGEVPKRLKGAVSKTARGCKSRMGSNPIFSARNKK